MVTTNTFDLLNELYLDWRGLIQKGLAIEWHPEKKDDDKPDLEISGAFDVNDTPKVRKNQCFKRLEERVKNFLKERNGSFKTVIVPKAVDGVGTTLYVYSNLTDIPICRFRDFGWANYCTEGKYCFTDIPKGIISADDVTEDEAFELFKKLIFELETGRI